MPLSTEQPNINIFEVYGVSYLTNRTLGTAYTYAQARAKYECFFTWLEWAGYNNVEALRIDEFSAACNDAFFRTSIYQAAFPVTYPLGPQVGILLSYFGMGYQGNGYVVAPDGEYYTTFPILVHSRATFVNSGSLRPYDQGSQTNPGTLIRPDYANWVGPPAVPSAAFSSWSGNNINLSLAFNRKDAIRSFNWGGNTYGHHYGQQWCEGFTVRGFTITPLVPTTGNWNDPSFVSAGIAIWDPAEMSDVSFNFITGMNTDGIECLFGTPGSFHDNATFLNGIFGFCLTGGGAGSGVVTVNNHRGDDNGLALIGIREGFGLSAGGNIILNGLKMESLGAANYTNATTQGIPAKAQLLFDTEASYHNLTLSIFGANSKMIEGGNVDSIIRIANPQDGTRTTVNVQGMYLFGNNLVKNLLQAGSTRYASTDTAAFMAHSFNYTSERGVPGNTPVSGTFISHNGSCPRVLETTCSGRLAWLLPGAMYNYATCEPGWNAQTGYEGGGGPSTPEATTVNVSIDPISVPSGSSSVATAIIYDQFGMPFVGTVIWSVVSGPGTINSSTGVITTSSPGTVVVRATVTGLPAVFGQNSLLVTVVGVPAIPLRRNCCA